MVAILRLANAMDRSHYQKVEALKAVIREEELHVLWIPARTSAWNWDF